MLSIDRDKVCYIVVKARAFDAKSAVTLPAETSDPSESDMSEVLEDHASDPVAHELTSFIDDLNEEEQIELVALAWLGRGTYSLAEWDEAVREAGDAHNERTAAYLLGMPQLGDYLEEGLSRFGFSCEDFERGHL